MYKRQLLVLTGVTNPRMLLEAPKHLRPSFVSKDLRGLNEVHVAPKRVDDSTFTCGDSRAQIVSNSIEVNNPNDCNALRAACAVSWSLIDSGKSLEDYILPEFSL